MVPEWRAMGWLFCAVAIAYAGCSEGARTECDTASEVMRLSEERAWPVRSGADYRGGAVVNDSIVGVRAGAGGLVVYAGARRAPSLLLADTTAFLVPSQDNGAEAQS
jgi:hypothetical protein